MAQLVGISLVEMSNIESNSYTTPTAEVLASLIKYLQLDNDGIQLLYTLLESHQSPNPTAKGLTEYLGIEHYAKTALRVNKNVTSTDAE